LALTATAQAQATQASTTQASTQSTSAKSTLPAILQSNQTKALIEQLALFFDRFGFRRNLGRLWATLYLAPRPLSQQELADALGISAGLVSSALRELDHWGMIRVASLPGTRRTHFEAEVRLLRIVAAILQGRELPAVRSLHESVREARLGEAMQGEGEHLPARLRAIEDAARLYAALANIVLIAAELPERALRSAIGALRGLKLARLAGVSRAEEDARGGLGDIPASHWDLPSSVRPGRDLP
jgi:DNA-binding transcriptional regulator GbsR (MarR family)